MNPTYDFAGQVALVTGASSAWDWPPRKNMIDRTRLKPVTASRPRLGGRVGGEVGQAVQVGDELVGDIAEVSSGAS